MRGAKSSPRGGKFQSPAALRASPCPISVCRADGAILAPTASAWHDREQMLRHGRRSRIASPAIAAASDGGRQQRSDASLPVTTSPPQGLCSCTPNCLDQGHGQIRQGRHSQKCIGGKGGAPRRLGADRCRGVRSLLSPTVRRSPDRRSRETGPRTVARRPLAAMPSKTIGRCVISSAERSDARQSRTSNATAVRWHTMCGRAWTVSPGKCAPWAGGRRPATVRRDGRLLPREISGTICRYTGGRLSAQGRSASKAAAARRTPRSSSRGAAICRPTGNPASVKPQGMLAAGLWEKLKG